jgi:hypothetical protein
LKFGVNLNIFHRVVALIQHYLVKTVGRDVSIFKDPEFTESRNILDLCMKHSAKQGHALPPKRAEVISNEHEDLMWTQHIFGHSSPQKLLDTLIFYFGLHLCLRACSEHRDLVFGPKSQIVLKKDKEIEFLEYTERC